MTKRGTKQRSKPRVRPRAKTKPVSALVAEWGVPVSAALGSAVRLQGIEREIRARLPWLVRNCLTVENGRAVLGMPEGEKAEFDDAAKTVADIMGRIETLPVLPSEIEDILTITAHERQKWTKDGRLGSAGTRTVKLRGRAKTVTFHVFDPREVEDILDRDLATIWREEDAKAAAENRKRAAGKAALTRSGKGRKVPTGAVYDPRDDDPPSKLAGWEVFATDGLLH